jgi:PAS domain S-box-containing protein
MKISFEKKIAAGYLINLAVVVILGFVSLRQISFLNHKLEQWLLFVLIILSLSMLTIVFFILKGQLKANKKSEEELLKNQKLLQSIIDCTSNAISVKKLNGEYILVNKEYQSLFASKESDLKGKTNHEFLPKELADIYRNSDVEALKAGKEIQIEEIISQSDGPHIYLSVKFPLFDASNRMYAIGTISTDITERKRFLESLKAADAFFTMSIDSLVIALKNKFLKVNSSFSELLGYSNAALLEKPFTTYIFPKDIAITEEKIAKLEQGIHLVNFKNRWICKDGSIKWLSWNATADKTTGIIYAIARDITEELQIKQEEEKVVNELYESKQKLNMVIENISDGVLVANSSKQVILANEVANELFGIEDDSKISIHFSDHFNVLFPDGRKTFPVQNLPAERALVGEATDNIDVLLKNLETNEVRRVLLSGRPIIDKENHIVAIVVTIKDISKYKKLEEELEKKGYDTRLIIGFKKENSKRNK